MNCALNCESIGMTYGSGQLAETVLSDVSLGFQPGEACVLLGPSGSGKTTLLSIMGCLLTPTVGSLWVGGEQIDFSRRAELTQVRRTRIGFVFQHAQLLPFLSAENNLRVVARNGGLSPQRSGERIAELLERLEIERLARRKPAQLSGGQRQRVAIARALLHRPRIILADEPTAALDWEHGRSAVALLIEQARRDDSVLIVVTHDVRLVELFDRVLQVHSGTVSEAPCAVLSLPAV